MDRDPSLIYLLLFFFIFFFLLLFLLGLLLIDDLHRHGREPSTAVVHEEQWIAHGKQVGVVDSEVLELDFSSFIWDISHYHFLLHQHVLDSLAAWAGTEARYRRSPWARIL